MEVSPQINMRGRTLTGGGPQKFEVGDGPCIRPPTILRTTIIGCEAKYKLPKRRFSGGISSGEIEVFGRKRINRYCISDLLGRLKYKVQRMTKKSHQKFFAVSQTQCQVSAHVSMPTK